MTRSSIDWECDSNMLNDIMSETQPDQCIACNTKNINNISRLYNTQKFCLFESIQLKFMMFNWKYSDNVACNKYLLLDLNETLLVIKISKSVNDCKCTNHVIDLLLKERNKEKVILIQFILTPKIISYWNNTQVSALKTQHILDWTNKINKLHTTIEKSIDIIYNQ